MRLKECAQPIPTLRPRSRRLLLAAATAALFVRAAGLFLRSASSELEGLVLLKPVRRGIANALWFGLALGRYLPWRIIRHARYICERLKPEYDAILPRQSHLKRSGVVVHETDPAQNAPKLNDRSKHPVLPPNSSHGVFVLGAICEESGCTHEGFSADG